MAVWKAPKVVCGEWLKAEFLKRADKTTAEGEKAFDQSSGEDGGLSPITYFAQTLRFKNYDTVDWEGLAGQRACWFDGMIDYEELCGWCRSEGITVQPAPLPKKPTVKATEINMGEIKKLQSELELISRKGPMPISYLKRALRFKLRMSWDDAEAAAKNYDTDGSGKVSAMELIAGLQSEAAAAQLQTAFKRWDKDGSGCMSKEELDDMMRKLTPGGRWPWSDTEALFAECDSTGDGKISFQEFVGVVFSIKK